MGVEGSAPRPGHLYPQERPGTHCTGGWVGTRACSYNVQIGITSRCDVFTISVRTIAEFSRLSHCQYNWIGYFGRVKRSLTCTGCTCSLIELNSWITHFTSFPFRAFLCLKHCDYPNQMHFNGKYMHLVGILKRSLKRDRNCVCRWNRRHNTHFQSV